MSKIRKSHSAEFKYKVALEALKEQETLATLSQKYGVHVAQIQKWKSQLQKDGVSLFSDKRGHPSKSADKIISQLLEKIGKLTVEKDFFRTCAQSLEREKRMSYLDKNHPRLSYVCQCDLLSLNRSSTYYKPKESLKKDLDLMNEIRDIWERYPFYGYRRIQAQLFRQGIKTNHKRVQRLMNEAGLQAIYPKPKTSKKNLEHRPYPYRLENLELERSNQVWATDITYIKLPQGFVYLVVVIDVYSRYIISWRLSNSLSLPFCLEALNEALEQGSPEIFNTDQGAQFTSDEWIYTLVNWGIQPSMTGVGRCLDNIHCERFWRTLKYEDVYIYAYTNVTEARQRIGKFIEFYNHQRPHQSLGYKTPSEVYNASLEESWPDGYVDNSLDLKIELSTYPQAFCLTNNQRSQISLI